MCWRRRRRRAAARSRWWSGPTTTSGRRSARAGAAGAGVRAARAQGHRACRAGGARSDRARRRRYAGDLCRHAAGARRDAAGLAGGIGGRCERGGARLPPGRSDRLRAAADARRRIDRHPRGQRRQRRGAQDYALQRRPDGARRRAGACIARPHRQQQCQGRILSDRRGCAGPRYGLEGGRDRNHGGRRARHQHQGAAGARRKRCCSSACARPPWRRASRWWRRRPCFWRPTPSSAATSPSSPMWCSGPASRWRTAPPSGRSRIWKAPMSARARASVRSRGCGPAPSSGTDVHIGNFVEVKAATIETGAKANHLAYIGDATRRRGRQYRRRHHHLQLRRRRQAPHRHRQRRLHRLQFVAGGAGQDRRRRLCRHRHGGDQGRAGRLRWPWRAPSRRLRKAGQNACGEVKALGKGLRKAPPKKRA